MARGELDDEAVERLVREITMAARSAADLRALLGRPAGADRAGPERAAALARLREIERRMQMSAAELLATAERIRRGEEQASRAKADLVEAHLRDVVYVARRYLDRGVPLLDLVQEGNIGLMTAANKFDYRLGFRFSTYAMWWIRQAVQRALGAQGRTMRLPSHRAEALGRIARVRRRLGQELRREPSTEEIAAALAVPPESVERLLAWATSIVSLEAPVGEEGRLGDLVADPAAELPSAAAMTAELSTRTREQLGALTPRERDVLALRFGLDEPGELTLEEVGRRFGVTRERIRQIEARALSKLRHPARARALRGLLGS